MEQETISIFEITKLILFLGSITFFFGALYQTIILYKRRVSFYIIFITLVITRVITFISSYFIWANWVLDIDIMAFFVFLPALIPEIIISPLLIRIFARK